MNGPTQSRPDIRWDDFDEKEKWKFAWGYMWRAWVVTAIFYVVVFVLLFVWVLVEL